MREANLLALKLIKYTPYEGWDGDDHSVNYQGPMIDQWTIIIEW